MTSSPGEAPASAASAVDEGRTSVQPPPTEDSRRALDSRKGGPSILVIILRALSAWHA